MPTSCDSATVLNLSVINPNNSVITQNSATLTVPSILAATYEWIDCQNNTIIFGEISNSFTPTSNGSYSVHIMSNGCTSTTNCIGFMTTCIEDITTTLLSLYPNPSNDYINLRINNLPQNATYTIHDIVGKQCKQGILYTTTEAIKIADLAQGVYWFTLAGYKTIRFCIIK